MRKTETGSRHRPLHTTLRWRRKLIAGQETQIATQPRTCWLHGLCSSYDGSKSSISMQVKTVGQQDAHSSSGSSAYLGVAVYGSRGRLC